MHCTIYKKRIALNRGSKVKATKGLDNLVKRTVVLTAATQLTHFRCRGVRLAPYFYQLRESTLHNTSYS